MCRVSQKAEPAIHTANGLDYALTDQPLENLSQKAFWYMHLVGYFAYTRHLIFFMCQKQHTPHCVVGFPRYQHDYLKNLSRRPFSIIAWRASSREDSSKRS